MDLVEIARNAVVSIYRADGYKNEKLFTDIIEGRYDDTFSVRAAQEAVIKTCSKIID